MVFRIRPERLSKTFEKIDLSFSSFFHRTFSLILFLNSGELDADWLVLSRERERELTLTLLQY